MTTLKTTFKYKHESKSEMMAFLDGHLMAVALTHTDKDVIKAFEGKNHVHFDGADETAKKASQSNANKQLFGLLIQMIDNDELVTTLATQLSGKGKECIDFIRSSWDDGDQDDRYTSANDDYLRVLTTPLLESTTAEEFLAKCNEMHLSRTILAGSHREISDAAHADNVVDMVKKINTEFRSDVRHLIGKIGDSGSTDRANVAVVQKTLAGVFRSHKAKQEDSAIALKLTADDSTSMIQKIADDPRAIATLRRLIQEKDQKGTPCIHCGVVHGGKASECFALLRSQGKTPPNWDKMPEAQRTRIDARAAKIPGATKIGLISVATTPAYCVPLGEPTKTVVQQTRATPPVSTIFVDSQGGTGHPYHFIKDKSLFVDIDYKAPSVRVSGVVGDENCVLSKGLGTCRGVLIDAPGRPTCELHNCLYVPGLESNIFNVWNFVRLGGGRKVVLGNDDDEGPLIFFAESDVMRLQDDFTFRLMPEVARVQQVSASVITRGARGATHIQTKEFSTTEQVAFDLALQHLNDPAPDRAKALKRIMDNVPTVLDKATYNNTATDARMLANAPSMPAPELDGKRAHEVGAVTNVDGWDAGVISLLGNRYLFDCVDGYSDDISVYPTKRKSEFPDALDKYYRELNVDKPGVIDLGGVTWSDNEPVMVGHRMEDVAKKYNRVTKSGLEYRPTSNAPAETGFRLIPNEMRKLYIRTGVPELFWDFTALEAERLLRWTRERGDGQTPGELRTGKRADYKNFNRSTFGCRVVARLPIPWRRNKHQPRNVSGVNLGKARNQPGWHIWNPEYGFMTSTDVTFFQHVFPFKDGSIKLDKRDIAKSKVSDPYELRPLMGPLPPAPGGDNGGGGDDGQWDDDDDEDDYSVRRLHDDDSDDSDNSSGPPRGHGHPSSGDENEDDEVVDASGDGVVLVNAQNYVPPSGSASPEIQEPGPPAQAPRPDLPSARTRSAVDLTAQTHAETFGKYPDVLKTQAFHDAIADATTAHIEAHIAKITGVTLHKTKLKQGDPDWVPPPWFDLNSVRDPEVRQRWFDTDDKEIHGIMHETQCVEEVLLDSLTDVQKTQIIGSLTPRTVKRSGKDKSRVVARGDHMQAGVHYKRSHSPTIMHVSLRFLFALAASLGLEIIGGDATQAYLNAELPPDEHYYMWPPKSARQTDEHGRRLVWLVKKSLYGGRNAGRNWYNLLRQYLIDEGFEQCYCEPCVFVKKTPKGLLIMGVYVDDFVTLYSDEDEMRALYAAIQNKFKFTPQEPLEDICGIEVKSSPTDIILTLKRYITEKADEFLTDDEKATVVRTPADCDKTNGLVKLVERALEQDEVKDKKLIQQYRAIVGSILYAVTTVRAEAAFAAGTLARAMNKPTMELLGAAKRVLQYLYSTRELGIRYVRSAKPNLFGFSDSDWQAKCSTSGYAFFMACAVVSYLSKLQPTIAMSSAQAEVYAASLAGLEGTFLAAMYALVTGKDLGAIDLFVDSKGAADLSQDFVSNSRVRHFERRQLKIRELVDRGLIMVKNIGTDDNVSDIFTKALGYRRFEKLRKVLLNMWPTTSE